MSKRDELLEQAKEIQDFVNNAEKIKTEKEAEVKAAEDKLAELNKQYADDKEKLEKEFEQEKARIEEESRKIGEEQVSEALKQKEQAEKERDAAIAHRDQLIAEAEKRKVAAQAELDELVEQAKGVISEAEEAASKRDGIIDELNKAQEEQQKALEQIEADRAAKEEETAALEARKNEAAELINQYETQASELQTQIEAIQGEYEQAQRIIADSKNAEIAAEAAAQEIILNAEKQAVFLKEVALTESDKGAMQKQIEEKDKKIMTTRSSLLLNEPTARDEDSVVSPNEDWSLPPSSLMMEISFQPSDAFFFRILAISAVLTSPLWLCSTVSTLYPSGLHRLRRDRRGSSFRVLR